MKFYKALNYLSGSFTKLLPILIGAGLINAIKTLLGPTMLGILEANSDIYILLDLVYNAGFYFLPIFVGGFAAATLGMSQALGMFMGRFMSAQHCLKWYLQEHSYPLREYP